MSWSAVGRAALQGLPSPHLRISSGLEWYDISIDGEDKLIPISSSVRAEIAALPKLQDLLRTYPEWRVLLRMTSGGQLSTIRLGVDSVEVPEGVHHPTVIAAILEASPMAAPNLRVANSPACEMVSHVKTWSKDMEPAAGKDLGTFRDGFWEAILEDPRPGFDEALFVEDVLVALTVQSQSMFSLRAFNTLSRDGFNPHPQSSEPQIDKEFPQGFHLMRQHLGRRTRYLRLVFRGHVTLHGVEAFCIELLPPHGPMPKTIRTVAKVFEAEPAIAIKQAEKYQTFTYCTLSNDLATISLHLRSRLDLDNTICRGEDAMLAWCGSTRVEAFLLFLVSMMNQWCFVSLHRHALSSELKLLPQLQLLVLEEDGVSPGELYELKCLVLRPADIQDLARQSAASMPEPPGAQPHRLGNLIFTFGTTGSPKAVRRSHEELYAFLWLYAKSATPDSPCHLAYQPFSHMNEQLGTAVAFLQGSCIAFSSPETAHADAKAIAPTAIQGVPRFYEPLLNAYETKEMTLEELRGSLGNRVQRVSVGSAPVSARLLEFLKMCFESESCCVTNGYGATEVGPIAHNGHVNPNVEVRIVPCVELGHDEGGSIGEIRVRCKNERVQARGYVGASLNLDDDGYYCTGDIGRLEEGRLELLGRRGNVTKLANGFFVSAEFLEEKYVNFVTELDQVFIMAIPSDSTVSAACVQRPWSHLSQRQILLSMQKTARENGLATHEIVSEVYLEPQPWTVENGGLLENQKLNRRALMERYGPKMGAVPKDSMEIVRRCAEALRRGVKLPVAQPEVLEADLAAIPVAAGSGIPADMSSGSRAQLQRFFVTGSTGLLGRELVQELLSMGKDVVALVRRPCPNLPERVEQVVGDVSYVNLGADLSGLAFDAVWHCAAEVNWALSYAELRKSNVVGTWQVAQLCAERGVPLFFVSTISVAGKSETLQPPEALSNGYVLSKLAAERFVHRAFGKGLRGAVFRPGMLWGSSKTGRCHPNFFPTRFVSGCSRVRCVPATALKCDVTPVDYAAKVMIQACLLHQEVPRDFEHRDHHDSTYFGKVFNVFNPRSPSYMEMARLMDLEPVALEDYWRKVRADVGNPMAPLDPLLQGGLPCASDWGDENLRQVLGKLYAPPEVNKELLQVYLKCSQF